MNEAEFERLLEAVRTAIAPAPRRDLLGDLPLAHELPSAANENRQIWPAIPFPDGWSA